MRAAVSAAVPVAVAECVGFCVVSGETAGFWAETGSGWNPLGVIRNDRAAQPGRLFVVLGHRPPAAEG